MQEGSPAPCNCYKLTSPTAVLTSTQINKNWHNLCLQQIPPCLYGLTTCPASRWEAQIRTASLPAAKQSEPVPCAACVVGTRWIIAVPPVWHTESCSRKLPGTTTMPQTQSRQDFESISHENWALRWCLEVQRTRLLLVQSSSAGHRLSNWESFWNSTLSNKQFSLPRARHYAHRNLRTLEHAPSCIY